MGAEPSHGLGADPPHGTDAGGVHHRVACRLTVNQPQWLQDCNLVIPYDVGGGSVGIGGVRPDEAECGHAVYFDADDYGPL